MVVEAGGLPEEASLAVSVGLPSSSQSSGAALESAGEALVSVGVEFVVLLSLLLA